METKEVPASLLRYDEVLLESVSRKDRPAKDGISGERILSNAPYYCDRLRRIYVDGEMHNFSPYLECLQSKGRGKAPRIISKPSVFDKVVLTILKNQLHEALKLETPFALPNELIRSIIGFYYECWSRRKDLIVAKYDVHDFYGSIPHLPLLRKISSTSLDPHLVDLLKAALRTPTLGWKEPKSGLAETKMKGVPQGLPISNILASFYLNDIDSFSRANCLGYYRYVDDILIFIDGHNALNAIETEVGKLGLQFNEKSEKITITDKFEFLGYCFDNGMLYPRLRSQERFLGQIFKAIKSTREDISRIPAGALVRENEAIKSLVFRINFKITGAIYENRRYGWVAYFSQITDKSCLFKIQKIIERKMRKHFGENVLVRFPLKSLVASYFDMKYHGGSRYALNYDDLNELDKKMSFLVGLGIIPESRAATYSAIEVNEMFAAAFQKELHSLEVDAGYVA